MTPREQLLDDLYADLLDALDALADLPEGEDTTPLVDRIESIRVTLERVRGE